eukprot:TRINITY_DN1826_c0_g1_i1.p1 TRINITY_DN1826_c0_g1~~TRINITY_DN1826_c0_g1_i1.p1  ORF type:complete len:401 (+),score=74.85 TRINITY_DN1826_c0_g1_i1:502-1704(+)
MSSPDDAVLGRTFPKITHVVLDLDGTLLDTESIAQGVLQILIAKYGKTWTPEGREHLFGKRPIEASEVIVKQYELPCTPQEFVAQSQALLRERWHLAKALPGAERLLRHLQQAGVPMAIASSSPRPNIIAKLSFHPEWTNFFSVMVAGEEVENGKPAPDIFLKAAKLLGADPSTCLVLEDAPSGIESAKAAGMHVIAVPSLPKKASRPLYAAADVVLSSLLDVQPELWGLPPFPDWVANALPISPWYLGGPVIKGFGRGSKMLGIPTANLPTESFSGQLAEHTCGIYMGWAGLSGRGIFKMVMSVGWNPYFDNDCKTVEPWLLHTFDEDFYGEELRLVVVGYIRPEADFTSLEALVARIHEDGNVSRLALSMPPFAAFEHDPFLTTLLAEQPIPNKASNN